MAAGGLPVILFVDFEASSLLPGSFPIEVAWVDETGQGESYLIRPDEEWLDEAAGNPGWSAASAAVHGISLEMLMTEGGPAEQVARRAAEVLCRSNVVACSDNPGFDGMWLETLLDAGGLRSSSALVDVRQAYAWACHPLRALFPPGLPILTEDADRRFGDLAAEIISNAVEAEVLRPRVHHRALPDAESLWRTWRAVRVETVRRAARAGVL